MKFLEVKDYLTGQGLKPRVDFHIHEDLEDIASLNDDEE